MGYDRFPEGLIEEKTALLEDLLARNGRIVFTHDPDVAMAASVATPRAVPDSASSGRGQRPGQLIHGCARLSAPPPAASRPRAGR